MDSMPTADFGHLFELAHDAILIIDLADERVLDANRRACEIYGFARGELIGRSMIDLTLDAEDGADHVRQILDAQGRYSCETIHRRKDGSAMNLEINAAVVDYGGNQAILSINRDVTRRRREEQELALHRQHLESLVQDRTALLLAKIEELERFAYTVSHDLRSPLTTISGFLGLLERDMAAGHAERIAQDMARIRGATMTMAGLLDDLLRVSRAGRVIDEPQAVALGEPAHKAVLLATEQFEDERIDVVIASDLPTIPCDPARLQQVFQNLVENAVKYMGDQPQPRIRIAARREGDETVVFVEDNGIGIDPADQGRIFDLFQRLGGGRDDGSGVGLALVQRIIEAHFGRVWVESNGRGHGSTFCFVLPQTPMQVSPSGAGPR